MRHSCEESLKRLKTDYLDLYLYHWIGDIPLPETVECLQGLKDSGLVREWGVSNFSTDDMKALEAVKNGSNCAAVQDLYHIGSRGTEYSLKPYLKDKGMAFMAYCPLAMGGRLKRGVSENAVLRQIAESRGAAVRREPHASAESSPGRAQAVGGAGAEDAPHGAEARRDGSLILLRQGYGGQRSRRDAESAEGGVRWSW